MASQALQHQILRFSQYFIPALFGRKMAGVKGFSIEVDKVKLLKNWCAKLRNSLDVAER
jgi:hypothetical protein